MSYIVDLLRKEIQQTERAIQFYTERMAVFDEMGWEEMHRGAKNSYIHFQGRRAYLLKELQERQLKEHKRG